MSFRATRLVACAAALALGAAACDAGPKNNPVAESESAWGFLSDEALLPTSPQFLVNKKRGETFRVCLAKYMADALPGVAIEIEAAVNVWASYLGRSIPVVIETKDLPRARGDQTLDDVSAAYHAACGSTSERSERGEGQRFDVVVGMAKVDGSAVGITGASYSYLPQRDGTRKITSFSRYLFLRDYDLVPTVDSDGIAERWASLAGEDATAAPATARDLLATMLGRGQTRYAKAGAYLALPVLVHEIGHVWGLCDQYEGANNCDPRNSSSHRVEASIMGARGATQRLFLTDDDIEGIRTLGGKPGFDHDWGAPPTEPPAALAQKPVELARIEGVRRDGAALVVTYGVVTSVPARYEFALQGTRDAAFVPLADGFASAEPFDVPTGRLRIGLGNVRPDKYRVRLVVTPANGTPTTVESREP